MGGQSSEIKIKNMDGEGNTELGGNNFNQLDDSEELITEPD